MTFSPSLGRWLQEDPIVFEGDDANLYRYVGNSPTNATDPSGLQRSGEQSLMNRDIKLNERREEAEWIRKNGLILITVDLRDDYKGFPRVVYDASAITFDVLLSGHPERDVRKRGFSVLGGAFAPRTFFGAMENYCQNVHGNGWKPAPIEFRLTGLQFYPTARTGGIAGDPRTGTVKIPVLLKRKDAQDPEFKGYETKEAPLGHFYIEGYWVFKCINEKKESPKYAIATEGKVHTWVHAPYDKAFAEQLVWVRQYDHTIEWSIIGRPYDRVAPGMLQPSLQGLGGIYKYLKVAPGEKGSDLKIIKLSDIWKGFEFPQ